MTKKKDPLMEGVKAAMQCCIMLYIAKELRDLLGTMMWDSRWKCYVWLQNSMIQMSADCLMQVVSKMDSLEGTKRLV